MQPDRFDVLVCFAPRPVCQLGEGRIGGPAHWWPAVVVFDKIRHEFEAIGELTIKDDSRRGEPRRVVGRWAQNVLVQASIRFCLIAQHALC